MMGGFHSREELLSQVLALASQGMSRRAIARALGVSRNTVRLLLNVHQGQREREHSALPAPKTRAPRERKVNPYRANVATLMERFPNITAQRVFKILVNEGFDGGYSAIKNYLRLAQPKSKPAPSLVTPVYRPGQMGESDWSPYEVRFTSGTKAIIQAFSYVLMHSTRRAFGLYESNDLHALMDGHKLTFARFEGCAAKCKYDSQNPVVLRWEGHHVTPTGKEVATAESAARNEIAGGQLFLRQSIKAAANIWDVVIINCPPSNLHLLNCALATADAVLVPCELEPAAIKGLAALTHSIQQMRSMNLHLNLVGIFATKVNSQRGLTNEVWDVLRGTYGPYLFDAYVHDDATVAEANGHAKPVTCYKAWAAGLKDYRDVFGELRKCLATIAAAAA
jgi:cellulose biosynthesis protein BcsQ/transposase